MILLNIVIYLFFKYKHPFWSRSPVTHFYTFKFEESNLFKKRDPYNEEVTKLLPNEKWININTEKDTDLMKFSHLLDNYYMYHNEFKYKYNTEFIKWTLNTPYKHFKSLKNVDRKLWSSLLERDNKIIASITCRPLLLIINNKECKTFYVDYLCISKEHRGQYLAPKMILKVEPAVWSENQECDIPKNEYNFGEFNMYIFKKDGYQLPFKYLCQYSYYYVELIKLRDSPNIRAFKKLKKITSDNIDKAYTFFTKKVEMFKVFQKINLSEFEYIFLNDNIHCYLLMEDNEIIGFTSFYNCQIVKGEEKCCELFYIFGENIIELFKYTLDKMKENNYKYLFTTNLLDNTKIIEEYSFEWICYSYYHLYNYNTFPIYPSECALLMP
tara:strand:- start:5214 stop:6362 length:1149 start_codon:yes stop_codon:yes gene_type:complete